MNRDRYRGPGERLFPPHPLANQFPKVPPTHGDTVAEARAESLRLYRKWLRDQYADESSPARAALVSLAQRHRDGVDVVLVGCCVPSVCHTDVVRDAVVGIARSL